MEKTKKEMTRRDFLKGATILGISGAIGFGGIVGFPRDVSENKLKLPFVDSLLDLYDMRALAILDNSPYVRPLDDLCYRIAMECVDFDRLNKAKELLVERCLFYIEKFRRNMPDAGVFKHVYGKSFDLYQREVELPIFQNSTYRLSEDKEHRTLQINMESFSVPLLRRESDAVYEYLMPSIRLKKTRLDKSAPARVWRPANTIHNCALDMLELREVAQKFDLDLEDMLSIATMESMGLQFVLGRTGEIGRFQINPENIDRMYSRPGLGYSNPDALVYDSIRDPKVNATLAAMILKEHKNFPENIASYNGGKYGKTLLGGMEDHADKPPIRYLRRFSMYCEVIRNREFLQ